MKHYLLTIALSIALLSYGQSPIPKGSISDNEMLFEYAIYFLDDDILNATKAKDLAKKKLSNFQVLDSIPSPENVKGSQVIITPIANVQEVFPPADLEYLKYKSKGLNDTQKKALQKSEYALLLDFVCQKEVLHSTMQKAHEFIKDIVKTKNVAIYDLETRETLSKSFWNDNRLIKDNSINISDQITIHFYRKEQYCRAITLGMLKFGLPDISIENLSCKSGSELTSFVNLTAQTLFEQQEIKQDGALKLDINTIKNKTLKKAILHTVYENAQKKASIKLIEGTWEDGDPQNSLIEIAFTGENPQIAQDEIISKLFGSEDNIITLSHNEALLAASERAKQKIPELRKMFLAGLPVNSHLLIKFPFRNDAEETEWMWVEITKWNKNDIEGLLQNQPAIVTNLKSGQKVSKNINDMFDYILIKPDGSREGNETSEIIMKMQN